MASPAALAQDFTVEAGQTVGQQVMNLVGDRGVIEVGGAVSTAGFGEEGVRMLADDQILENFGHIATTGITADGIYAFGANTTITNFGSIEMKGAGAQGIVIYGDNATINNFGSLETAAATGSTGYGIIVAGDNATITNSGSIETTAQAIVARGDNATVTNSGTIVTTRDYAYGIDAIGPNATITNSGSIVTTGASAYGIVSIDANTTITNSGSIISEQFSAIAFGQGDATLNLLAGTAIQGGVVFSGTGNLVRFGPGLNALMTFYGAGIPGTVETSGNPFVIDGNTIAVLDRGGFALADDMTLALGGAIAGAAGRGLESCMPGAGEGCSTRAWLTGIGGFGGANGSADLAGFEHLHGGALAGLEFMPEGGIGGGLFIGGVAARGTVGTSQETSQHGAVAGGHAGFRRDGYFADFYAALGVLQVESERTVADNTGIGGLDVAGATHAAYFFNPAVTVGTDIATGHGTLTPSLRLRYTGLLLDGYAESGADDGLVVDARAVHEVELRAQLALALLPGETEAGSVAATLRAGADVIHRQGDTITAELLGEDIAFASGGEGTRYRGFAGFDVDVALANGASLRGRLEGAMDTAGGRSAVARVGVSGRF